MDPDDGAGSRFTSVVDMDNDPIAQGTYVILGLVSFLAPAIAGFAMISSGNGMRRRAQASYLRWLADHGYGPPPPGPTALANYPAEVALAGRGLRTWGGVLLGIAGLMFLARAAAVAGGV